MMTNVKQLCTKENLLLLLSIICSFLVDELPLYIEYYLFYPYTRQTKNSLTLYYKLRHDSVVYNYTIPIKQNVSIYIKNIFLNIESNNKKCPIDINKAILNDLGPNFDFYNRTKTPLDYGCNEILFKICSPCDASDDDDEGVFDIVFKQNEPIVLNETCLKK